MTTGTIRRVLVVDDEEDSAWALATMLGLDGFDVRVAHDGASAVEQCVALRPDAIVMDIGMPGIDGVEAASAIARLFAPQDRPRMIAITGLSGNGSRQHVLASGFDAFLSKPADFEDVRRSLDG